MSLLHLGKIMIMINHVTNKGSATDSCTDVRLMVVMRQMVNFTVKVTLVISSETNQWTNKRPR